jgi:hypothetical protein
LIRAALEPRYGNADLAGELLQALLLCHVRVP